MPKSNSVHFSADQIIQNTIKYGKGPLNLPILGSAEKVSSFLSHGGINAKEKKFSSVLYIKDGEKFKAILKIGPGMKFQNGIYAFKMNPGGGVDFVCLDDPSRIAKLAFSSNKGKALPFVSSFKLSESEIAASYGVLWSAICGTSFLFNSNKEMAIFLESLLESLCSGSKPLDFDSQKGVAIARRVARELMASMDSKVADELSSLISAMTVSMTDIRFGEHKKNMGHAKAELLAQTNSMKRTAVSFEVSSKGKLLLNIYSGTEFPGKDISYHPAIWYQIQAGGKLQLPLASNYIADYKSESGGFDIDMRENRDIENLKEDELKASTNADTSPFWQQEVKLFKVPITAPAKDLLGAISQSSK